MAFLSGADGGTRTRDLFLTKEVLYLLSYISVSMILTVYGDLSLPAFLPPAGFTGVRVPLGVPTENSFGGDPGFIPHRKFFRWGPRFDAVGFVSGGKRGFNPA